MGYVIDPAWAPNGQMLAFSWRRPSGNYDIYVMEAATGRLLEITRDSGRNERPSWAPDGRHIVFESTSRRLAPDLDHARRRHSAPSTNHHRPQRIAQLVAQVK